MVISNRAEKKKSDSQIRNVINEMPWINSSFFSSCLYSADLFCLLDPMIPGTNTPNIGFRIKVNDDK